MTPAAGCPPGQAEGQEAGFSLARMLVELLSCCTTSSARKKKKKKKKEVNKLQSLALQDMRPPAGCQQSSGPCTCSFQSLYALFLGKIRPLGMLSSITSMMAAPVARKVSEQIQLSHPGNICNHVTHGVPKDPGFVGVFCRF